MSLAGGLVTSNASFAESDKHLTSSDVESSAASHPSQISFGKNNIRVQIKKSKPVTIESLVLIGGSANLVLAQELSELIKVPLLDAKTSRFSDGEVSVKLNQNVRGKDVFIIQSCAAPVNDSIIELLLTVSCARRSGARRVIAVIPYFGYKHHRRGTPISTRYHSRFLSSSAMDFAKMLSVMGVDRVISVDLQRPGQGHEACFFDNAVPLETVIANDLFIQHLAANMSLEEPLIIIAPNAECIKKAKKFQKGLQPYFQSVIKLNAFISPNPGSGPVDVNQLQLLGDTDVSGSTVIIVDDMVDTAGTLYALSNKLKQAGAKKVIVCASHGLFSEHAMELIDVGPINQVLVSNTLPKPLKYSDKIQHVSIAPLLADVILTEHFRSVNVAEEIEQYEFED
eukprot:gene5672-7829_t